MMQNSNNKSTCGEFRTELLVCVSLVVILALLYGQVRNFDFVNFDDDLYVTANPVVQKGTLQG